MYSFIFDVQWHLATFSYVYKHAAYLHAVEYTSSVISAHHSKPSI